MIQKRTCSFLKNLMADDAREWFEEHEAEYHHACL